MASLGVRLAGVDQRILLAVVARRTPWLDGPMRAVTVLANASVVTTLTVALALGLLPGLEAAGREAAVVLCVSHLLVQIIKRLATRPRPALPVGIDSLIQAPDRFSFPSGHATAGLSVALPIAAALSPALGAAVVGLGVTIGISRCYLGIHYPGDVIVGWGLAAFAWILIPPA